MLNNEKIQRVHWEAQNYDQSMGFVSQYGEDIVKWLNPQKGEKIIDFGCGTGDLADQIASSGAEVLGVDISPEMIERAKSKYPNLAFECADGMNWTAYYAYDAVFSNAALHWMKEPNAAIRCMISGLKSGGRLVAELGGHGNVNLIVKAVRETLLSNGREDAFVMPWYFPSVGEYSSLLEDQGMEVRSAALFDRPTLLHDGEEGMNNWLTMFGTAMVPQENGLERVQWFDEAIEKLKETRLYDPLQGEWRADYRRLRIFAVKR